MKKFLITALSLACFGLAGAIVQAGDVTSLRGENPLDAAAQQFDRHKQTTKEGGFQRSWKQAPPSIPHSTDKDEITMQVNTCLKCHSDANYKKEKAPRLADSHFMTMDGKVQQDMDMRRYFCNQCHTPQLEVKPLVENTFETVKQ